MTDAEVIENLRGQVDQYKRQAFNEADKAARSDELLCRIIFGLFVGAFLLAVFSWQAGRRTMQLSMQQAPREIVCAKVETPCADALVRVDDRGTTTCRPDQELSRSGDYYVQCRCRPPAPKPGCSPDAGAP